MDHLDLEQLQRYLRAQMGASEREAAAVHLSRCPACRRALADEQRFSNLLQLAHMPELPAEPARMLESLQKRSGRRIAVERLGILVGGIIACTAAAGIGRLFRVPPRAAPAEPLPGISRSLEIEVVAHLGALETLAQDGALVENLPLLDTFSELLAQRCAERAP